jgi:hypothetical protein
MGTMERYGEAWRKLMEAEIAYCKASNMDDYSKAFDNYMFCKEELERVKKECGYC